jgi:hypothetical protein
MFSGQAERDYVAKLALRINEGAGPAFVLWNGNKKIHVVVGRASLPEDLSTALSLGQWREYLRPAIAEELVKLGWEARGGNRYWRQGTTDESELPQKSSFIPQAPPRRTKSNVSIIVFAIIALAILVLSYGGLDRPEKNEDSQALQEAARILHEAERIINSR